MSDEVIKDRARAAARSAYPTLTECEQCGAQEDLQRHHPNILEAPLWIIELCRSCHVKLHAQLRLRDQALRYDATLKPQDETLTLWVRLKGEERARTQYMRDKEKRSFASLTRMALASYYETFYATADDDAESA